MSTTIVAKKLFIVGSVLIGLAAFAGGVDRHAGEADRAAPVEPLRPGVTEDRMFAELVAHNDLRNAALRRYQANRTYQVSDPGGKVHAQEVGRMEYLAPDKKTFVVTSEAGSGIVRRLALGPLIASEVKAAAGQEHHDSAITPANYTLKLLGEQQLGPYHCFVARAVPKRVDKYLFDGKIWIDAQDYAVVRIEGHPAANLSFWITRADFVREYQKIDGFWLPQRDETSVHVRFYGTKILTIDHRDYVVEGLRDQARKITQ